MRSLNLTPDHTCWNSIIQSAIKLNNQTQLNKLLKEMETIDQLKPNIVIYHTLIEYYIQLNNPQLIIQIIKEMEKNQLSIENKTIDRLQRMQKYDVIVAAFENFNSTI